MSTPTRRFPKDREPSGPIACSSCDLKEVCRLCGLISLETGRTRQSTGAFRTVEPGAALFRTGSPAHSIYAIRKGMLKTVSITAEGEEHVLGIHTPGEVLGLEAFGLGVYACEAIAVQPVICCELPLPLLDEQSKRVRDLGVALVRLLSRAAGPRSHPARGSVRQRVTAYLLDLARRLGQRGLDARRFPIGLNRQELADLLDTRIESVSRTIQRLNRERAIHIDGSAVTLLSLTAESRR